MRKHLMALSVVALASAAWSNAAAAQDIMDEVAPADEAPYVAENGEMDLALAHEYAELVDSYVDEKGVSWNVWLDEYGGQMWAESVAPKTSKAAASATPMTLIVHLFLPGAVQYWRGSPYNDYVTYWRTGLGTGNGEIEYTGGCGNRCSLWTAYVGSLNGSPWNTANNVWKVLAYGTSTSDYCDDDYSGGYYYPENGGEWDAFLADNQTCEAIPFGYKYWIGDDDFPTPTSDNDFMTDDYLVEWQYRIGSYMYSTIVQYVIVPE